MSNLSSPNTDLRLTRRMRLSLLVRSIIFGVAILAVDGLIDLGTNPYLLILSSAFGIFIGHYLARARVAVRGGAIIAVVSLWALNILLDFSSGLLSGSGTFQIFSISQHILLSASVLLLGTFSTIAFFKFRNASTFEIIVLGGAIIFLLAPHRDYHLDSPQFVSQLAWHLGLSPQAALLICGALVLGSLLILSALLENSPFVKSEEGEKGEMLRALRNHSLGILAVVILCFSLGKFIYSRYDIAQGLTTNGVGEANQEGTSPLGFHSALGSTNQPAALVRLEGDYSQNPFTPMLYLREGALSKFNGKELVIAQAGVDTDVPNTPPAEIFSGTEDKNLTARVAVTQSIYLLADQKVAYGVDYPITIKQLKNPDPNRFRMAFRTYSLAPTYKLDEIDFSKIGDTRWSNELWNHYTEQHADPRYRDLALKLTAESPAPIQKAKNLLEYLSKNSIYTLTPKHEVKPDEDPVAPYLFGDMRGYCVHFAHATVYMLRGLGIPSRIATGYMTDLSQAKDGHILLRMSDRHAWAEIYIEEKGWVPFDIQPEQVENAAETQVDAKLLEELMGKLDPGEEILPKEKEEETESPLEESENIIPIPAARDILIALGISIVLLFAGKLYLRYAWLLPGSLPKRIYRAHRSGVLTLADLGISRNVGETWNEFQKRASGTLKGDALNTTPLLEAVKYAPKPRGISYDSVAKAMNRQQATIKNIPWWRRFLGVINPLSIFGGNG